MVSGHTLSSLVSINSASDFQITIVTIIVYVRKSTDFDDQSNLSSIVLLRAKEVGFQISVSFEKFDVVQALLSFFLTLFQLRV
jgi:hypothetical protein